MSTTTSSPLWETHVPAPMTPVEMPASPSSDTGGDEPMQPTLEAHNVTVVSPYTPAPSPQPFISPSASQVGERPIENRPAFSRKPNRGPSSSSASDEQSEILHSIRNYFNTLTPSNRKRILGDLLSECDIDQLVYVSNAIAPRLKRDFLRDLPVEIALHVLSFIDDPRTLSRCCGVSRFWKIMLTDEYTWKVMCLKHNFGTGMREAYRSVLDGNLTWEAKRVMTMRSQTAVTDALSSAMETKMRLEDEGISPDAGGGLRSPFFTNSPDNSFGFRRLSVDHSPGGLASRLERPMSESRRAGKAVATKPRTLMLPAKVEEQFSFQKYFKLAYLSEANWRRGGRVLKSHTGADDGVVTSVAMNDEWIVAGLVNHRIHVFSAETGAHVRTLVGHTQGVWCLALVTKGGSERSGSRAGVPTNSRVKMRYAESNSSSRSQAAPSGSGTPPYASEGGGSESGGYQNAAGVGLGFPGLGMGTSFPQEGVLPRFGPHLRPTDVCNASVGWGQASSLVVSGGCDRELKVWDVTTGYCLHSLKGHSSTIRCLKVLDGRPIVVSGSRDTTLRVWDIQKGQCLFLLSGHTHSVRCLDVAGNIAVSGSYDGTARMWNVDTGECLRVFEGHYHQIYAVAFDGIRVATGSLDSTIRIWSPETGVCTALLQGHTSLVGQLQLSDDVIVSGGSDGRVIIFSLKTFETMYRLCAHDNSVTCLQFDDRFLITGGNDGHVKLFEVGSGAPIRELTEPCEAVWRVMFRKDKCVIMCKRGGKTVMEILSFRPQEEML
ncbi:hypothetical protein FRB95_008167 [Tulasnella sp. JGI-2019a]|nr:hypothetical protein FRB95_008167 [Tulasnella sp. JGI-2019a]